MKNGKDNIFNKQKLRWDEIMTNKVINGACLLLFTCVIMDTFFWVNNGFMIPSWTMAVMSMGMITLFQIMKQIKDEKILR